jgi:hypothetical protein
MKAIGEIGMASQRKTKPARHVALAYPVSVPWMALFMRGVTDYAEQRGGWLLTASPPARPRQRLNRPATAHTG